MRISRAIDVGYGNTKLTLNDGLSGEDIRCKIFPSVAPVASSNAENYMERKDTVLVDVGSGDLYEVGPDAMLEMASNSSRTLDYGFSEKKSYMALVLGAMHYMDVDHIDHLVVGLPVSGMSAAAEPLKKKLIGTHRLPRRPGDKGDLPYRTITVGDCRVVPQPVGGMYDFGVRHGMMKEIESGNNLLIDPGFFTLDWVMTKGMKMQSKRSGAAGHAGMAAVLRAIAKEISAKTARTGGRIIEFSEDDYERLDHALRMGIGFEFYGQKIDLKPYLPAAEKVIKAGLEKVSEVVGSFSGISRVIIVGGAAHVYKDAIQAMFKDHAVVVAKDAVFSNVRGFQILANYMAHLEEARLKETTEPALA